MANTKHKGTLTSPSETAASVVNIAPVEVLSDLLLSALDRDDKGGMMEREKMLLELEEVRCVRRGGEVMG